MIKVREQCRGDQPATGPIISDWLSTRPAEIGRLAKQGGSCAQSTESLANGKAGDWAVGSTVKCNPTGLIPLTHSSTRCKFQGSYLEASVKGRSWGGLEKLARRPMRNESFGQNKLVRAWRIPPCFGHRTSVFDLILRVRRPAPANDSLLTIFESLYSSKCLFWLWTKNRATNAICLGNQW